MRVITASMISTMTTTLVTSASLLLVGGLAMMAGAQTPLAESKGSASPRLLWPDGAPGALGNGPEDQPSIQPFLPTANPTRTAVLVAPGGGYGHLSMQKEGDDIARWLNARGVAAYVLKYRLGPKYRHPIELGDAQRALRLIRSTAAADGIDSAHVGMWGFSAGGHLAATAGTLVKPGMPHSVDAVERQSARPDFLILAYPVVTMEDGFVHKSSRDNLLGEHPAQELVDALSPERHVTSDTPATFLFATTDDGTVPAMNSVLFYSALIAARVPAELHLFQHGPHGVGLAAQFADLKGWPDLLATWMRARGFMEPAK